jgi:hypothetical protein
MKISSRGLFFPSVPAVTIVLLVGATVSPAPSAPLGLTSSDSLALTASDPLALAAAAAVGLGFAFIVHEAFHQFQREAYHSLASDLPEEEYPILDGENTALASREMLILMDAIRAVASADTSRVRVLTAEFLAIRNERWNRRPTDIPLIERPQELMEGPAKYVEVCSVGRMGDLCGETGPATAVPGCGVFAGMTRERYLLSDFEDRISEGVIDVPDMPRNRVYPVGPPLACCSTSSALTGRLESPLPRRAPGWPNSWSKPSRGHLHRAIRF